MGKHFLLIHGAWHGSWCWDGVIGELEKSGHTAEAVTLPGHQPDAERSNIQFSDYTEKIITKLNQQPSPVILVGHSSAGFMLQAVAPKAPEKIERLIFLNAFILPNGKSQFDLVPPEVAEGMTAAANASPDNCVPVMEDFVRNMLMAKEPVELQDALIKHLIPQPIALFQTPVDTQGFEKLSIPKTVIFCKDDASLPPSAYLAMAQELGTYNLVEVDGSHEALITNPSIVAKGMLQAVQ
ncbi:MAG: alpha/beta fold hydrolase [Desulfobacteraceae bacterium]|jgi:pimeloyl-ACP methyl ester carboxylesterase